MAWLKSEGKTPENDKVWELSDAAYRLWDASRHYAVREMTDGHVPLSRVSALTPKPSTKVVIAELTKRHARSGHAQPLWHVLPDICDACLAKRKERRAAVLPKTGYVVHDFLVYNPTKAEYEESLDVKREAGRRGGLAKADRASTLPSTELSSQLSTPLSTVLEQKGPNGLAPARTPARKSTLGSASTMPSPYPVLRTPVSVAIATVPPAREAEPPIPDVEPGHGDAARSGSQVREGLHQVGATAARIASSARGAR